MSREKDNVIFTRDLLIAFLDYMDQEKTDALEFNAKNLIAQIQEYNDRFLTSEEEDSKLH